MYPTILLTDEKIIQVNVYQQGYWRVWTPDLKLEEEKWEPAPAFHSFTHLYSRMPLALRYEVLNTYKQLQIIAAKSSAFEATLNVNLLDEDELKEVAEKFHNKPFEEFTSNLVIS